MKARVTMVRTVIARKVVAVEVAKFSLVERAARKSDNVIASGVALELEPWRISNIEVVGAVEDLSRRDEPDPADEVGF